MYSEENGERKEKRGNKAEGPKKRSAENACWAHREVKRAAGQKISTESSERKRM